MIACLCAGMYRCILLVVKVENKSLWILLLCFPKTSHPPPDLAFSQALQFFLPFSTALLAFHHYFIVPLLQPHHFLPHAACPVVSARYHVVTLWYLFFKTVSLYFSYHHAGEWEQFVFFFWGRFFFLKCNLGKN